MTVLDSRPELPMEGDGRRHDEASDVLITDSGVSMSDVVDMGAGRGPAWLDEWLTSGAADVVAWRRHIHAHPEVSRQEHETTELIAGVLRSVGLHPEILPGGTGLICDIGSGERCVALRADIDALPLTENTGLPFSSTNEGACHACGHDAHTAVLLGAAMALASAPEL
ncbi:M20/M25/M40 family metallo-hydrolase, partial [Kutzneria sp. 744]|uniref:M20/M25/M40 family metallo-hydrolase n=2 Tax=unclassified Kutzneria TaxID=2621979 RepID=UPI0005BA169D